MKTYVLTIGGVVKQMEEGWSISDTLNGHATFTAEITSLKGTYRPAIGAEVVFTENGVPIFGGHIDKPSEQGLGVGYAIVTRISVEDYNALADRRFVQNGGFPAGWTVKQALTSLVGYLAPYGVMLDPAQANGIALPLLEYDVRSLTSILDELSVLTGWVWRIDYLKRLRMHAVGDVAAPFSLTSTNGLALEDVTVESERHNYANRIIVQAGSGTSEVTDTWTATSGQTVFPLTYRLSTHRGYITVAGVFELIGDAVPFWVIDTAAGTITRASGVAAGTVVTVTYIAQFPFTAIADSGAAPADLVERTIAAPDIFSATVAQALAAGYLARALDVSQIVRFRTRAAGFKPGQVMTISIPGRNLSGSFLITDITTTNPGGAVVERTLTATGGSQYHGSWRDDVRAWSGSSTGTTVGGNIQIITGGGGASVGSGTVGTIPTWLTGTTLGDSVLTNSGARVQGAFRIGTGATTLPQGGDGLQITSVDPVLDLYDSDQPAELKRWRMLGSGGALFFQTVNDAYTAATTRLSLDRAGAASVTSLSANAVRVGAGSAALAQGANGLQIASPDPILDFYESDQPAELKRWRMLGSGGALFFQTVNDAYTAATTQLSIDRAGTASMAGLSATTVRVGVGSAGLPQGGNGIQIAGPDPILDFYESDQAVNLKRWRMLGADGALFFQSLDDAYTTATTRLSLDRAGSAALAGQLSVAAGIATPPLTNLTLRPTGDLVLDPSGNYVLPALNYDITIGRPTQKFLGLHVAELVVDSLVASDVRSTVGGRVMVAPTTELMVDITATDVTIATKHNILSVGDILHFESRGNVEFMLVTAIGGTIQVPWTFGGTLSLLFAPALMVTAYAYTVTRNLDASGANAWQAGDAIVNTRTPGYGFIDLYATGGTITGAGPTIVGNVRTGTTFNQLEPRWAIGNLAGLYGYGTTTYGAAFGDPAGAWVKIDATAGVRLGYGSGTGTTVVKITGAGASTFEQGIAIGSAGSLTAGGVVLNASGLFLTPTSASGGGSYANDKAVRWTTDPTYRTAIWRSDDSSASAIKNWSFENRLDFGNTTVNHTSMTTQVYGLSGTHGIVRERHRTQSSAAEYELDAGTESVGSHGVLWLWGAGAGSAIARFGVGTQYHGSNSGVGPTLAAGFAITNSGISATGAVSLNSTLTVTGAAALNSTLTVTGAATLNSTLTVSTLTVTGAAALNSTLTVTGAATLNSTLSVGAIGSNTGTTIVRDSGGFLRLNTSSETGKTNIRRAWAPANPLAFLGIAPIQFDYPGGASNVLGFSAEDFAASGLAGLVNYNAAGAPESIREHAVMAYMLVAVKALDTRVTLLESRPR